MVIFDVIIWLAIISIWIYGLFIKDQSFILVPLWGLIIYSFINIAYSSIFHSASFSNWFDETRIAIFLGFLFCMIVYLTTLMKYQDIKNWELASLSYLLIFLGMSYIFGSTFLNYGKEQYVISAVYFFYAWLFYAFKSIVTQKKAPLFAIFALNVSAISYLVLIILFNSQLNIEVIRNTILGYTQPFVFLFLWVLIAFSKHEVVEEKKWDKLKKVYITLVIAGLTFHHPEIKMMSSELVDYAKNVVAIGDASAIGYIAYITSKAARLYV